MSEHAELCAAIESLSEKQRRALGLIAIGRDECLNDRTVDSLVRRGLVERRSERIRSGQFMLTVMRYSVPVNVHLAWCGWCAKNGGES